MQSIGKARAVVLLHPDDTSALNEHDLASLQGVGHRLADLMGCPFASWYPPGESDDGAAPYFIPLDTLVADQAARLGIASEDDFYGGVVPHGFLRTKVITHPVVDDRALVPEGWSSLLGGTMRGVVLPGYSVFSRREALIAGRELLTLGPVRVKPAWVKGGGGQKVGREFDELHEQLRAFDEAQLREHGLVLEQNLDQVSTYSVGEIRLAGTTLAYYGSQRQTINHHGQQVYGGSDLFVSRGTLAELSMSTQAEPWRSVLRQALLYDQAVRSAFPGVIASRRNYDVAQGFDREGYAAGGVLEQSWRVGGATPAELAALQVLMEHPDVRRVHASCREVYGETDTPDGADVYFRGVDRNEGFMSKYSLVVHGGRWD